VDSVEPAVEADDLWEIKDLEEAADAEAEAPVAEAEAPAEPSEQEVGDQEVGGLEALELMDEGEAAAGEDGAAAEELGTVDELTFDDPRIPTGLARLGAIDEAVAELDFDDGAGDSVVDRSPPPPVAPRAGGSGAGAGKGHAAPPPHPGQQAQKPKGAGMVIPPPPARGSGARAKRGAEAAQGTAGGFASGEAAGGADAVFGYAPAGAAAGAPFAGSGSLREVDVFAQTALGPADLTELGGEEADEALNRPATGRKGEAAKGAPKGKQRTSEDENGNSAGTAPARQRGARGIVPPRLAELGGSGTGVAAARGPSEGAFGMPASGGGEAAAIPAYPVGGRRNVGRTIMIVVVLMLVFMALAAAGIFYWIKPKLTSEGVLQFQKFGSLTRFEREQFIAKQQERLLGMNVLTMARSHLMGNKVPLGFLESGQIARLHQGLKTDWDAKPGAMVLRFVGDDKQYDPVRLEAMLLAMYQENAQQNDREIALNADVAKLNKQIEELSTLKGRYNELLTKVSTGPTQEQVKALREKVKEAEKQWKETSSASDLARLEVERAQRALAGGGAAAGDANAGKGNEASADPEVAKLQKELEQAASKLAAAKGAASELADQKRVALDKAVESFQQMAAGMARENPELGQYIASAKSLQDRIQRLGNHLINVQQEHFANLTDMQKRMNEMAQARRVAKWAEDKELGDLQTQMDLAQRGYNALTAEGYAQDSKDVRAALAKIQDLNGRIESRRKALADDPVIAKYSEELNELIRVQKNRLEADKAQTEKDIKDAEQEFAQGAVAQKLSESQKAQAAVLQRQQHAINELRKEYAGALEKKSAESNEAMKALDAQVADLRFKIDERQRVAASEGSKKMTREQETALRLELAQKQNSVKLADEQARKSWEQFHARNTELRLAEASAEDAAKHRPELEAVEARMKNEPVERQVYENGLEAKKDELKKLVTVAKPEPNSVKVVQEKDDRWLYLLGSWLGIVLVFGVTAVIVSATGGERGAGTYHPLDADTFDPTAGEREETAVG
jgi:hypothetical protein